MVTGIIVIIFGLSFIWLVNIPLLEQDARINLKNNGDPGFIHSQSFFGLVFSNQVDPCVGAFLGSALMLAAQSGERVKGILMLLVFLDGAWHPVLSAVLIEQA